MNQANNNLENVLSELGNVTALIKRYIKQSNKSASIRKTISCRENITLGKMCVRAKFLVKKARKIDRNRPNWSEWRDQNIPQYSRRSVEDFMLLARIPEIENYIYLGKAKLMEIGRCIDLNLNEPDPIGDFLRGHNIAFNPEDDEPIEKTKLEVDVAISLQGIADEGIEGADRNLIRYLLLKNIPIGKDLIRQLKAVRVGDGDVNRYLSSLCHSNGTPPPSITNHVKYFHFNDLAVKIDNVLTKFGNTPEFLKQVEKDFVESLIFKLSGLIDQVGAEDTVVEDAED